MNPISFTSTYKVSQVSFDNFLKFQSYALDKELKEGVTTTFKDHRQKNKPFYYTSQRTLIVPDNMDNEVETFCLQNGIKYTKLENKDLLQPKNILARIKTPPQNYAKVMVDSDKLEEYLKTQDSNFEHCKENYELYFREKVQNMLKSGDPIPAPVLHISSMYGGDISDYVTRYGADKLNDEQVSLWLCQRTSEPEHCLYFALRELGMKKIPFYIDTDQNSYINALALGLC